MTYTTPLLVQSQIRGETSFSSNTIPSLPEVETWIAEAMDDINHKTGQRWDQYEIEREYDYTGADSLRIKESPIISIDEVAYRKYPLGSSSPVEWEVKSEDTDYTVYLNRGEIRLLTSWNPAVGNKRIRVQATCGYATTPSRIQELATKMVAIRVIESVLYSDVNLSTDVNISVGSVSVVNPSNVGIRKFEGMKLDVDRLFKDIIGSGVVRYDYS